MIGIPSEIVVSSTVSDLIAGSEFAFADHGTHHLDWDSITRRLYSAGPAVAAP